ncbi:MAG: glycosyltransferase family 4 protein [bacterium]
MADVMRIGYFTSIDGWGGSEVYLKSLMLEIRQAGREPVLIGVEGSRLFRELQLEGLECVAWKKTEGKSISHPVADTVKQVFTAQSPLSRRPHVRTLKSVLLGFLPGWLKLIAGNIKEVRHLRRLLVATKLDVLQVNLHGYEMAGVAARFSNIRTVGFFHISPVQEASVVRRWLIKWTGRQHDVLCFPSRFAASEWNRVLGVSPEVCRVVPHGVDTARFLLAAPPLRAVGEPFRLVSVGRLHPMKGYSALLDAMAALGDRRVFLDILGEGDELDGLKRKVMDLGLTDRVHLHGHVNSPENIMKNAHAFILLSNSHESFGLAVVEAMAAGLPVITSDFGPFPEINEDGVAGFVVPVGDANGTAEAIRRLVNDDRLRLQLGQNGQQRALRYYRKERMVGDMVTLYHSLLTKT